MWDKVDADIVGAAVIGVGICQFSGAWTLEISQGCRNDKRWEEKH